MSAHRPLAVVTGASSGIGMVYAERLAERGYNLLLVARRKERLEELRNKIRAKTNADVEILAADLGSPEGLAGVASLLGQRSDVDLLVNNAGLGALGASSQVPAEALRNLVEINVQALTSLSHAVLPGFLARNRGTIVNIASIIALIPSPTGASYSGSKAYVLNFSRSLQLELAKTNVKVQVVLPGPVRTEFFEASGLKQAPFPDEMFISAAELVDLALAALDRNELVFFPSLEDMSAWTAFEAARIALVRSLTKPARPAAS
ncbi:SDR family oxidoreductase [Rhodopseudomonas palustris]|uniref:SDR family NAD(P)-dependent oxidoreductase n=1 Tax=Rhodopseudomonas palustris TaxID=1076 RepID=UPI0020CEF291|nr:SDR family oxidoreductase [Rhodopseudomonas palustris]MCP9626542.1 SDR family oxidoreductase [Rhodopseudomonas palustris]